ncbi:MAG: hypothetical protein ACR2IR_06520 [Acidimicrobiia bacterium]
MEVQTHPEATLVDVEETAEPRAEEGEDRRISIGHPDLTVGLEPFTRVERDPGCEKCPLAQYSDALNALLIELLDLTELLELSTMRSSVSRAPARLRRELDASRPDRG